MQADADQKSLNNYQESQINNAPTDKTNNRAKTMAVIRAFIANVGIALVKFVCFYLTKSSAMLSESIHSGVDGFNSICLLVGIKRGSRPADTNHQFGYGLETNIWTLFACLIMFSATLAATIHGIRVLLNGQLDDASAIFANFHVIVVSLLISICFEMWAVKSASEAVLIESQAETYKNGFMSFIKSIK